jgi:hypothetical protein
MKSDPPANSLRYRVDIEQVARGLKAVATTSYRKRLIEELEEYQFADSMQQRGAKIRRPGVSHGKTTPNDFDQ